MKGEKMAYFGILVIALILLPLIINKDFLIHVFILILMYGMAGQAWDLIGGQTGQIALGHAVFFGIGAYTSAFLFITFDITPWIGMIAGGFISVIVALIIGYPCFKLRGHYFLLATLGIAEIARTIFANWDMVGGSQGLFIPLMDESFLAFQFHTSKLPYYYIILGLAGLAFLVTVFVKRSKLGYYFNAIREDEEAAKAMGINVQKFKFIAFSMSAFLTSIAGTFYAQYLMYVDPGSVVPFMLSVQIVLIAILGGMGTNYGPFLGALVLIPLSEVSRQIFGGGGAGFHLIIYGLLIVLISIYQPAGLAGWIESLLKKRKKSAEVN